MVLWGGGQAPTAGETLSKAVPAKRVGLTTTLYSHLISYTADYRVARQVFSLKQFMHQRVAE